MKSTMTRLRASVAAAVLIGATVVAAASTPVSASSNATLSVVELGPLGFENAQIADGARFGVVTQDGFPYHVDLDTGTLTEIGLYNARVFDAAFAYQADYYRVQRQTIATGEFTDFEIPNVNGQITDVVDATPNGRFLVLEIYTYFSFPLYRYDYRNVLYDTFFESFVTSPTTGFDPGGRVTTDARISDDGDVIRYRVRNEDFTFDEVEVTRSSGFRQSRSLPAESFTDAWSISDDFTWEVFRSSDEAVGIGISTIERLYRRNLDTGVTTRVNIDAAAYNIRWFRALDDGRVVAVVRRFVDNISSEQLYVWSNSDDPAHLITQSPTGDLANGSLDTASITTDATGERIAFASTATNLAVGADTGDRRLYLATLDPVDPNDPNPGPPPLIQATLVSAEVPVEGGPSVLVGPTADAPLGPIGAAPPTNPETVVATGPGGNQFHFDLATRELVESDIPALRTGTDMILGASGDSLYRQTVSTGEITKITPDFPVFGFINAEPWVIVSIDDLDDTERYVLFTAVAGAVRRAFIYDMTTGGHVPWAADGIGIGDFDPDLSSPTSGLRFTEDGNFVLVEREWRSPDILKWDIATGVRTTHSWFAFGERPYTVSDDLVWETFWSSDDPANIGDTSRRPYRRNTRTGAIDAIPLNGLRGREASVHAGGRIILVAEPTTGGPSRLFVWDGDATEATEVVAGPTGPDSNEQIVSYHYDEPTEIVTFLTVPSSVSVVENLSKLYQADLTDPLAPRCMDQRVTVNLAEGELPTTGDDVIYGTAGRDIISGGTGNDVICAGGGDDVVDAGPGNDIVDGEDGVDSLYGGDDDDQLIGGDGSDLLLGEDGNDVLFGDDGNDILLGGGDNDVIVGGLGNDLAFGQAGTSLIFGGAGNDYLGGTPGDDAVFGQEGDDSLFGFSGNDYLYGQLGNDTINGGTGNDLCVGGPGTNTTDACEVP